MLSADAKRQTAGTYTVSAENENGCEKCSVTLIVTEDEKEMEDWLSQLKRA